MEPPVESTRTDARSSTPSTSALEEEPLSPPAVAYLIRRISTNARKNKEDTDPFDVHDPHWTFERALKTAIDRSRESGTGRLSPHVSLCCEDLCVTGDDIGRVIQKDATSLFADGISVFRNMWKQTAPKSILKGVDSLIAPGEMLLILGAPGSGCTTLLKVLAGQTDHYRDWDGSITYSGISLQKMRKQFRSMLVFNGEKDAHFPYLTVAQTIDFAASTKTPHQRIHGTSRERYIQMTRDILLAALGLVHTANTRVGNDFVRGISGGERRRVSIAEMVGHEPVTRCALLKSDSCLPELVLAAGTIPLVDWTRLLR